MTSRRTIRLAAPEQAILDGIAIVTQDAGITAADVDIVIHGTTLATNALIERRGARTCEELQPLDEAAPEAVADRIAAEGLRRGRDRLHPRLHEHR